MSVSCYAGGEGRGGERSKLMYLCAAQSARKKKFYSCKLLQLEPQTPKSIS